MWWCVGATLVGVFIIGVWAVSVNRSAHSVHPAAKVATDAAQNGGVPVSSVANTQQSSRQQLTEKQTDPTPTASAPYEIILTDDTIIKTPDQQSSPITVRTSDGSKAIWTIDTGRSGLTAQFESDADLKPTASFTFWLDGSIDASDTTATIQIIASPPYPADKTTHVRKNLTVTAPPATFSITFDDITTLHYEGDQQVWTTRFIVNRHNGHTAALSGAITLSGCPQGIYALPVTFSDNEGYVTTRSDSPLSGPSECTVELDATDGGYKTNATGVLRYNPEY